MVIFPEPLRITLTRSLVLMGSNRGVRTCSVAQNENQGKRPSVQYKRDRPISNGSASQAQINVNTLPVEGRDLWCSARVRARHLVKENVCNATIISSRGKVALNTHKPTHASQTQALPASTPPYEIPVRVLDAQRLQKMTSVRVSECKKKEIWVIDDHPHHILRRPLRSPTHTSRRDVIFHQIVSDEHGQAKHFQMNRSTQRSLLRAIRNHLYDTSTISKMERRYQKTEETKLHQMSQMKLMSARRKVWYCDHPIKTARQHRIYPD